jgi:hypothetical protein
MRKPIPKRRPLRRNSLLDFLSIATRRVKMPNKAKTITKYSAFADKPDIEELSDIEANAAPAVQPTNEL